MTVRFAHTEIESLLAELTASTGREREDVLLDALRHERDRLGEAGTRERREAVESARLLRERWNARPRVDHRPIDEIIAFDDNGLPV